MNVVLLTGTIARDPTTRETSTKKHVSSFRMMVKKGFGEGYEYPDCVAWGDLSDKVAGLRRGDGLAVQGELQTRSYDKDGKKVYVTEVYCKSIEPLGTGGGSSRQPGDDLDEY